MTLPRDHAEHAVLGVALAYPGAIGAMLEAGADVACFNDEAHRRIFGACTSLLAQGEPVDVVTVFSKLNQAGHAEQCGGLAYLNALVQGVPGPQNAAHYARKLKALGDEDARRRQVEQIGRELLQAAAQPAVELAGHVDALAARLHACTAPAALAPLVTFAAVPIADLATREPEPQAWWLDGYVPAGHVTLFTGHGGVGKSLLNLMLACAIADGRRFLGKGTRRGRVLFFSAEDPAELVRRRLRRVCAEWGVEPAALAENLRVIDATELDAALYVEHRAGGVRHGATTPVYEALRQYVEREHIDVAVLDNASDLFDGDEIVRQLVRGFVRSLAGLIRARGGAVVLLAHVDKGTSRAGKGATSESYSGSTAWHNSVRSRLALLEKEPGLLELQHQKCNLGPKQEPLLLSWPQGGLPALQDTSLPPAEDAARPSADASMRALVALIRDYYERGEWVSTSVQSQSNAARLLSAEARYPRHLKPTQVAQLLREAQRARFIETETYRGADRKERQRWRVTAGGVAMVDNLPLFASAVPAGAA